MRLDSGWCHQTCDLLRSRSGHERLTSICVTATHAKALLMHPCTQPYNAGPSNVSVLITRDRFASAENDITTESFCLFVVDLGSLYKRNLILFLWVKVKLFDLHVLYEKSRYWNMSHRRPLPVDRR